MVAITESVVARCQGNYATVQQIAADVKAKTGGKTVGVTFPHPQPQPFLPPALRHCLRCEEDRAAPQLALR